MFFLEFLIAFIFALLLSALFIKVLRKSGPRTGYFWFFLVILLATWAGGIWLSPFGPSIRGVYWLPFLLVGLAMSVVITALAPRRKPRNRDETLAMLDQIEEEKEFEKVAILSMNLFFRSVVALLIVAIIIRYLLR